MVSEQADDRYELAEPGWDFDDVARRATPRLVRYAWRRLGDRGAAQEVVQEALLRAYTHRANLPTEDDVQAWTTVVTARLVVDRLRHGNHSVSVPDVPEGRRQVPDTAEVVEAREDARLALEALEALPGRQASVLWAREVEGLSYEAIAARHVMTEAAVRSTLHRARRSLRREYAARGGVVGAAGLVALAPWLPALRRLHRLRQVASALAGSAVLGAAGLGALGTVPAPFHLATPPLPRAPAISVAGGSDAVTPGVHRRTPARSEALAGDVVTRGALAALRTPLGHALSPGMPATHPSSGAGGRSPATASVGITACLTRSLVSTRCPQPRHALTVSASVTMPGGPTPPSNSPGERARRTDAGGTTSVTVSVSVAPDGVGVGVQGG